MNRIDRLFATTLFLQNKSPARAQDLAERFGVDWEKADRMNLSSIYRYLGDHDIKANPYFLIDIQLIAKQRNHMAHEMLANIHMTIELAGAEFAQLFERGFARRIYDLELAFQRYWLCKEADNLYIEHGVHPYSIDEFGNPRPNSSDRGCPI